MITLFALWMPILFSAIAVFVVSSIIHMVLQYHKNDFKGLPDEKGVRDALRGFKIPAGTYHFPHAGSMKEYGTPEFTKKLEEGPNGIFTVYPDGVPGMGGQLTLWFVYSIIVGVFAAYIGRLTLSPGAEYLIVARVTGTVAFCGYSLALLQNSIWYKRSWVVTMKSVFDGFIYALLTGGFFGWLWPGIAA
ncbi:MAG: hypothetical protein GY780_02230 [bacterium]|nr:hypothetical protein [bacterium]